MTTLIVQINISKRNNYTMQYVHNGASLIVVDFLIVVYSVALLLLFYSQGYILLTAMSLLLTAAIGIIV